MAAPVAASASPPWPGSKHTGDGKWWVCSSMAGLVQSWCCALCCGEAALKRVCVGFRRATDRLELLRLEKLLEDDGEKELRWQVQR